jgi:single-stranded DNA-binding protein
MNSCVLMAKIVRSPQLRYTQDNQLAVIEMMVEFDSLSPQSQPSTLKVVGWGNLATEIEQKYGEGDRVILTGRLKMDTIERPEGFKEKRAELTVSNIYPVVAGATSSFSNVVKMDSYKSPPAQEEKEDFSPEYTPSSPPQITSETGEDSSELDSENLDNIPF